MSNPKTHLARFPDTGSDFSVIFDDDGYVAYAYLIDPEGEIASDVWLYNHGSAPLQPEWETSSDMPFKNATEYITDTIEFAPVDDCSEIRAEWVNAPGHQKTVHIFIRNRLFAILAEGEKPGYSLLASKNGPLAKRLEENL